MEIKNALKVLTGYCLALIMFVVFLPMVLSFAKDNFSTGIVVYSMLIFLLMFSIIYSDMKKLGGKERRPEYNLKPYPLKGLVLGLVGFLPVILLELLYPVIVLDISPLDINRIKHLILNTLLGPVYGFVKLGNESLYAYAAATLMVPVIAMLGYMAGYFGIEISLFKKKQPSRK